MSISFSPTEEQRLLQEQVLELARTALGPAARDTERLGEVSAALRGTIAEMGLALAAAPEAAGGLGLGMLAAVLINEGLARGDAAALFALPGFGPFTQAVIELGSAAQQRELLAPWAGEPATDAFGAVCWSEPIPNRERAGMTTVAQAEGEGWELSGTKTFVGSAGRAQQFLVFAEVDGAAGWSGLGAFVVPRDAAGLKLGAAARTLGLDCGDFRTVTLERVRVPGSARLAAHATGGEFTRACLRFFVKYGLLVAARQVGLARTALETARAYAEVRKAFGKPIGHFQAIAFTIADRHMDAESAAELCHRAAWAWDSGRPESECLLFSAQAIAHAHEAAMRCGDDAVQLHGGAGFIRDLVVEKLMRDTKQLALCGLTAEQADQLAAALDLGATLAPELVLPTPDCQAVFT